MRAADELWLSQLLPDCSVFRQVCFGFEDENFGRIFADSFEEQLEAALIGCDYDTFATIHMGLRQRKLVIHSPQPFGE